MVEHNNYLDVLLTEFQKRNPKAALVIDYAEGVATETDYPAEVHIPKERGRKCQIILDVDARYSDILMFVAEGLASVEAGFDANDSKIKRSAEHYAGLLARVLSMS